jgi:hypothetical protein
VKELMDLVRPMAMKCLQLNATIKANHIHKDENTIADSLSHFQMEIFHRMTPQSGSIPNQQSKVFVASLDWEAEKLSPQVIAGFWDGA